VAVAVIAGGGPKAAPARLDALAVWGRAGVPSITSLIDDLRAIATDTIDPATASPAALTRDETRLVNDLAAAKRLAAPPGTNLPTVWNQTLATLADASHTLRVAANSGDPAAVALAQQQFEPAGNGLLEVGQAVQSGG
jgi:hypothetical protein